MAAKPVKSESGLPNIAVTYDADADVLFITNGEDTAFGDSIANGVAMFYDQDPGKAGALAVGMHIIGAQGALKPFVGRHSATARHRAVTKRSRKGNGC